jgi:hypothetical protein
MFILYNLIISFYFSNSTHKSFRFCFLFLDFILVFSYLILILLLFMLINVTISFLFLFLFYLIFIGNAMFLITFNALLIILRKVSFGTLICCQNLHLYVLMGIYLG